MPGLFVDTSALVKYYYPEEESERIEGHLLKARRIYLSSLTIVEVASALMKKVRQKELSRKQEMLIWNAFLDDLESGQIEVIPFYGRHYDKAADIIREFGEEYAIKTLDALQLSVAHGIDGVRFLCSDKVLLEIAREIGIKAI